MDRRFQVVVGTRKAPAPEVCCGRGGLGQRLSSLAVGLIGAAAAWLAAAGPCLADTFWLKQGGSVEGTLANPDEAPRQNYIVKTDAGATVTLDRAQVTKVVRVRPALAEYEKSRSRYPDTVDGQWQLAEWCRQQNLAPQRRVHLARVVELEPDHEAARRALGYSKIGGKWQTTEEHQAGQGMVRRNGKWITTQEDDLLNEKKDASSKEREWIQKVRLWVSWLPTERSRAAEENLRSIKDPAALRGLSMALGATRDRPTQALLIRAVAKLETPEALHLLAQRSMVDEEEDVRAACLEVLKPRKSPALVEYYVGFLRHKANPMVNRAGAALKEMEDPTTIEPLIGALVTIHKITIQPQNTNTMNPSFGKSSSGSGTGMGMGAKKPTVVPKAMQNESVLEALVKITRVNFAFDVPAWRNWHQTQKQRAPVDGRRG